MLPLDLDAYARRILFGTTLADKLAPAPLQVEPVIIPATAFEAPDYPGRPPGLQRGGRGGFPDARLLGDPTARGHVLHFFANHELLAMELMALALLRFPHAAPGFRLGLAHTIAEEQTHMQLYLDRMRELGVELGELPVSDFFWNRLRHMRSPLEFVTQMSLTFEQANLDFSLHYRDAVARHGDERTAAILDRVYEDEIGHVKHGVVWFNRWRNDADEGHDSTAVPEESDWDAYRRLLPLPLTPRRARGTGYCIEARRRAGLSETFIRELAIHSGSRGRPPVVWWYNPNCDAEIARGTPGFMPSRAGQEHTDDLAPLLLYLARDADIIVARRPPRSEWLHELAALGFTIPEFVSDFGQVSAPKLGGCEPWGWSPEALARLRPLRDRIVLRRDGRSPWHQALLEHRDFGATGLAPLFSKVWSTDFARHWLRAHPETTEALAGDEALGVVATTVLEVEHAIQAHRAAGRAFVLKAPWSTSGQGIRRLQPDESIADPLQGWIRNTVTAQGSLLVEPWLDRMHDFSIQIEVQPNGAVKLLGAREFWTGPQWQYGGTFLGRTLWHLDPAVKRLLARAWPAWRRLAHDLGAALAASGYRGPAGIDAFVYRDRDGILRFKPVGEVNPRWTMGRIALALETRVAPGARAAWVMAGARGLDARAITAAHPLEFVDGEAGRRIARGVLFTTDPESASAVVTALAVGDGALSALEVPRSPHQSHPA